MSAATAAGGGGNRGRGALSAVCLLSTASQPSLRGGLAFTARGVAGGVGASGWRAGQFRVCGSLGARLSSVWQQSVGQRWL